MSKFSERLKELRTENKLSTKALAMKIGVSDTSVCNWENGKHDIKGDQLLIIAEFFGVTTDFLLGLVEN